MPWTGTWRNQYGSTLVVTNDAGGRIEGSFRTALRDSGFFVGFTSFNSSTQECVATTTLSGFNCSESMRRATPCLQRRKFLSLGLPRQCSSPNSSRFQEQSSWKFAYTSATRQSRTTLKRS